MGEFRDEESICRSMHHLSTAAAAAAAVSESPDKHAAACFNSTKRQASLSPFREPVCKRATLHFPSSPAAAGDDHCAFGFKRLPLPQPFPASPTLLRRTLSEPIHSPNAVNRPAPPPQSPEPSIPASPVPRRPLQEIPENTAAQFLCRTVSDPNPFVNIQLVPANGTPPHPPHPPRPPLGRNVPRSPSCGESPSSKRLRRMKERLKEMSQWWNQVVHEGEQEDDESENYCTYNIQKEESEYESENPSQKSNRIRKEESEYEIASPSQKSTQIRKAESDMKMGSSSQEAVWVEKNGECLVLHFKCPCGTGYQILLSGNDCYYKLTNF